MAAPNDNVSMALFCDFENVALGVRDAQYEKFDIRPVLERLLAKGSIVVKKAYCDWDRYKSFKAAMHEANFELIEIPHVRQSGKNSADIRMVVDALDLCYTKSHVDTFVIISGDSDFSPLVSKLRENAKRVIGVGVKQSCSDLLVTNCDEFIYYDDLVRDRDSVRGGPRREREKRSPEEEAKRSEKQEERKSKAIDIVSTTFADLVADRGESDRLWASVLKEVVKRRNPGFNENYYGFRSFGNLLEEASNRGLLGFGRDEKGAYVFRAQVRPVVGEDEAAIQAPSAVETTVAPLPVVPAEPEATNSNGRRRGTRRSRYGKDRQTVEKHDEIPAVAVETPASVSGGPEGKPVDVPALAVESANETITAAPVTGRKRSTRRPRQESVDVESTPEPTEMAASSPEVGPAINHAESEPVAAPEKPRRRSSRPVRKASVESAVTESAATPVEAKMPKPRKPRSRKASPDGKAS